MLTKEGCLQRQMRLKQWLADNGIEAAVITDARDVYYFTGLLLTPYPFSIPCCLWLETQGAGCLIGPVVEQSVCIEEYIGYEANLMGTISPNLMQTLYDELDKLLRGKRVDIVAYQREALSYMAAQTIESAVDPTHWTSIDDQLASMQSCKDADEIQLIRRCIEIDLAAYTAVQAAIVPGATELEVLAAGQQAALLEAGEWVYHNGDYRCGAYNGPARPRQIQAGEIYIVDAWTCYRGYWSDLSRAFTVGNEVSPLQQSLFNYIAWILQEHVPNLLKPGMDGQDIWRSLDQLIRQHPALAETGLIHHGGHSIGLRAHEMPDINRDRGGKLQAGQVMCVELGGYPDAARGGVRLENMYLLTADSVENLSPYPLRLSTT